MIFKKYKFEETIRVGGLGLRKFKVLNKGPFVSTDRQMDGQTEASGKTVCPPFQGGGGGGGEEEGRHNYPGVKGIRVKPNKNQPTFSPQL